MTLTVNTYGQEQKSVSRMAEEAYAREEYATAAGLYSRLARKPRKVTAEQLMKLGRCYAEIGRFSEAAHWYRQVISRPDRPAAAYFALGETLRNQELYAEAKQQYALFTTKHADSLRLKELALQSCDSAVLWKQRAAAIALRPRNELNTTGSDWVSGAAGKGVLLVSNGLRKLALNGDAEAHPATDKRTDEPFYKPYFYGPQPPGHVTMYLEELAPALLGDYRYHIGPVCLSSGEDTMYVTINVQQKNIATIKKGPVNGIRRLALYQSVKHNGVWSPLTLLPGINIEGYASSHAVLNKAGNLLYFVSDRPGGFGQTDIWYCEKQADGSWGQPVNCGDRINTVAAETFPTVNEEGILYFSSKGYAGLGGYDIYRAKGNKTSWETPENLLAPFNSGADDLGFILKTDSTEGFLASNRPGGLGRDDIYAFAGSAYYSGREPHVPPAVTGPQPPAATPEQPAVKPGKRPLTAEEEADKSVLEQLQFLYDFNSASLKPESRKILDQAAEVLKRRPHWKLMVLSFADSRGSNQYNIDLSALRCYSVIDYLVRKGISPRHLYYSNRGEQEPVNNCKDGVPCNEEEHRENRRSTLKVITGY